MARGPRVGQPCSKSYRVFLSGDVRKVSCQMFPVRIAFVASISASQTISEPKIEELLVL